MAKSECLKIIVVAIGILLTFAGCATERHISPSLSESPRTGLDLKRPVLCAVFDGRASQEPKDAASTLQDDLRRIYGSSIEWNDYFMKTPHGRVAVRVRLVTLCATFGNRLVSTVAFANAVSSAQGNATGPWGTVVGDVSAQQSVLAGSLSGEGWWNGAAWIDVEVQDYRGDKPISFTLPIVAEHRESNMWGYRSGDKAARTAWQRSSVQLTRAMDSILRTVRDQE
ncbi:MAG: hypothetical protein A4E70_01800 [Syntrophus sp. PtaU1.Bin005]|nr:MAG: hypothetical protein A4E70_01800 [Syntrophus sp. PtaU1.Bin005]